MIWTTYSCVVLLVGRGGSVLEWISRRAHCRLRTIYSFDLSSIGFVDHIQRAGGLSGEGSLTVFRCKEGRGGGHD